MKAITILALMLFSTTAFCLNEGTPAGTPPGNLTQQYKNLKEDLEVINGFRMVKLYNMDRFWNVVEDSLRAKKSIYQESVAVIAKQKSEIEGLNASLQKIEKEKV